MNIQISERAVQWFEDEFDLNGKQEYIRFYARYGGNSDLQSGFSLGINKEQPNNIGAKAETDHLIFFIEESDLWYFKGYNLEVTYNDDQEEIKFVYTEQ